MKIWTVYFSKNLMIFRKTRNSTSVVRLAFVSNLHCQLTLSNDEISPTLWAIEGVALLHKFDSSQFRKIQTILPLARMHQTVPEAKRRADRENKTTVDIFLSICSTDSTNTTSILLELL